jgi:ribonuclease HI
MISIYIDGSSNGFDSCICFIAKGGHMQRRLRMQTFTMERIKSIFIEYEALLKALDFVSNTLDVTSEDVIIFTDSMQIYKEINLNVNCSILTLDYVRKTLEIMKTMPNIKIEKINRSRNPAGLYLAKRLNIIKGKLKEKVTWKRKRR